MRISLVVVALGLAAFACRREMPPRDYRDAPPDMRHPVTSSAQSPSVNGMKDAAPEPSTGVEGKNITRQPASPIPPTLTLKDQAPGDIGPPAQNSQHATQTTATAVTGTHLAPPP